MSAEFPFHRPRSASQHCTSRCGAGHSPSDAVAGLMLAFRVRRSWRPQHSMSHPPTIRTRPSRIARARARASAPHTRLRTSARQLIGLRDAELDALDLPETLADAIRLARRTTSRGGAARQRQYIGKLMRDVDLDPIRAALSARSEQSARDAASVQTHRGVARTAAHRRRRGPRGAGALAPRTGSQCLVAAHRGRPERASAAAGLAGAGRIGAEGRELFRMLRTLFGTMP